MKVKFLKMLEKEKSEQSEDITEEKITEIVSNVLGTVLEPLEKTLQGFDTRMTSMESSIKTLQEASNDKEELKSDDEEGKEEEKTENEDEEDKEKTEQSAMESRIASAILKGLGVEEQTSKQSEKNTIENILAKLNLKPATDGKQLSQQSAGNKDFVTDENGIVYQNVE
nr:hypothetical protein [Methanobrevibacter arboriphilus]